MPNIPFTPGIDQPKNSLATIGIPKHTACGCSRRNFRIEIEIVTSYQHEPKAQYISMVAIKPDTIRVTSYCEICEHRGTHILNDEQRTSALAALQNALLE